MDVRFVNRLLIQFYHAMENMDVSALHNFEEYISTTLSEDEAKEIKKAIIDTMTPWRIYNFICDLKIKLEFFPYFILALQDYMDDGTEIAINSDQIQRLENIQKEIDALIETFYGEEK